VRGIVAPIAGAIAQYMQRKGVRVIGANFPLHHALSSSLNLFLFSDSETHGFCEPFHTRPLPCPYLVRSNADIRRGCFAGALTD